MHKDLIPDLRDTSRPSFIHRVFAEASSYCEGGRVPVMKPFLRKGNKEKAAVCHITGLKISVNRSDEMMNPNLKFLV